MVTRLADLLRYSLSSDRRHTVPLADELAIVEAYLALEHMRFEDRLHVERDVEATALTAAVPPMLVLTLVENAVKHGIADSPRGGTVRLRAAVVGQTLEVRVENTGEFRPVGTDGRGLRNITTRLRLLYGHEAALDVRSADDATAIVVSLPRS
jgi:LytS/YehU family sensor histidine kinase